MTLKPLLLPFHAGCTAVLPQPGLFTFLSHPQEYCNASGSTAPPPPPNPTPTTTEPHPCEPPGPLFKAAARIPFSLSKQTVKTPTSAVISQVTAIITDVSISISDGQLQPDASRTTQKAPITGESVLKRGPAGIAPVDCS